MTTPTPRRVLRPAPTPEVDARIAAAQSNLAWGVVLLVGGALVSLMLYKHAQAQAEENGSAGYLVFWGPMLFGALRIARGARELLRKPTARNDAAAESVGPAVT